MKLYKSWLWPATCTIILVVIATYATAIQAAKQKQAEVNYQQVAVSPSRSLKYGDKTTKKIPNQEVHNFPTASTTVRNKNTTNVNRLSITENQNVTLSRRVSQPRTRIQHLELSAKQQNIQMSRRYDGVSQQNYLEGDYGIPIVHKNRDVFNKSITPTAIGGQQITAVTNRSRSINTRTQTQQQPQPQSQHRQLQRQTSRYSNSYIETEQNIAKTLANTTAVTTTINHKKRQRKPTTTTTTAATTLHTVSSTNAKQSAQSAHNSHVIRSQQQPTAISNNTTIVRHYHSNQRNKNNNNNNNNSNNKTQPLLLASSHAIVTANGGLQTKTKSSSNKQTGNTVDNESVSGINSMNSARAIVRKTKSNASSSPAITIISATSSPTSTTTTTVRPQFQLPSSFNIFTPEFWQFLNPTSSPVYRVQATTTSSTTTTTRKPPKKYKPPTHTSTKEEKLSLVKPKPSIPPRSTTRQPEFDYNKNTSSRKDEGPFRIALPTFNILSSKRETHDEIEKGKRNVEKEINLRERFDCPRESEVRFQLFPKICKIDEDCKVWNREEICCDIFGAKSCVSGLPKPLEETSHAPILGVIPRKCPSRPLAELWWEVKECENDMDCWPRVCCPDGRRRYCRTSQPELNTVPVPVQRSFNYFSEYLECTPPPPPIFDLHPKPCTSTLDCFPNVCCQEAGLRHCRPPKKSVLTMLANVFNVDFVKRLTQNIVIK